MVDEGKRVSGGDEEENEKEEDDWRGGVRGEREREGEQGDG